MSFNAINRLFMFHVFNAGIRSISAVDLNRARSHVGVVGDRFWEGNEVSRNLPPSGDAAPQT